MSRETPERQWIHRGFPGGVASCDWVKRHQDEVESTSAHLDFAAMELRAWIHYGSIIMQTINTASQKPGLGSQLVGLIGCVTVTAALVASTLMGVILGVNEGPTP